MNSRSQPLSESTRDSSVATGNTASAPPLGTPPAVTAKTRIIGFLQVLLVVALVMVAIVFSREDKAGAPVQSSPAGAGGQESALSLLVRTVVPVTAPAIIQVKATGSVGVRNQITLIPEVTGRIVSMDSSLREGGAFTANQTLLIIDPKDFELAVAQAEAEIASARANLLLQRAPAVVAVVLWP